MRLIEFLFSLLIRNEKSFATIKIVRKHFLLFTLRILQSAHLRLLFKERKPGIKNSLHNLYSFSFTYSN